MGLSAESLTRVLAFVCASVPAATAAIVPLWLVSLLAGGGAIVDASWSGIVAWAVVSSLVVIKFVPALLVALAWPTMRVGVLLPVIWAAAVVASSIVVIEVGTELVPQLARLRSTNFVAVAAFWLCIEIVGTISFPALIVRSGMRQESIPPPRQPDTQVHPDSSKPTALSADLPKPISVEEVFRWLRDVAADPTDSRPRGMMITPDGRIRTTHRQLAAALQLTKANCSRRLVQLQRRGKIAVSSTREGTWIRLIDDDCDSAGSPTQRQPAVRG